MLQVSVLYEDICSMRVRCLALLKALYKTPQSGVIYNSEQLPIESLKQLRKHSEGKRDRIE